MKSAIKLVVGLSVFAAAVSAAGCSSSDSSGGPKAVGTAGSGNTGTAGASNGGGTSNGTAGGSGDLPPGISITPTDGWVDGASNELMVQGALFTYSDKTTMPSVHDTIATGMNCMNGTAAKVDLMCVKDPGQDCYGTIWGAAMGLNLNQPTVMDGGVSVGGDAMPFDGSKGGITGFAFDVSGNTVPTAANFRFVLNDGAMNQYCTPTLKGIKKGPNVIYLKDMIEQCWLSAHTAADKTGDTAVSSMVKIGWQVVTNSMSTVPFDFCVDNIEALTTPAP